MTKAKKMFTVLLTLVMALGLSLSVTAFAASDGQITVTHATNGQTYTAYKLFDATVSGGGVPSYTYTVGTTGSQTLLNALNGTGSPFTITQKSGTQTYVVSTEASGQTVVDFLKTIASTIEAEAASTSVKASSDTASFTGLDYGYYYITSTVGTIVALNSAAKTVSFVDKQGKPSVDKEVKEDSTNTYGATNTADIGDVVDFRTKVAIQPGAKNYVLHDDLSTGLTLKTGTIKVQLYNEDTGVLSDLASSNYTVTEAPTGCSKYGTGCDFQVAFTETYLNSITKRTVVMVTYQATVNANATVDINSATNGNVNRTILTYGDNNDVETEEDTTKTFVFGFDVRKYDGTTKNELTGVKFELYKDVSNTKYYAQITNGKLTGWTTDEDKATQLETDSNGRISIDGLDAGSYFLTETQALDGYIPLTSDVEVTIAADGTITARNATQGITDSTGATLGNEIVNVENTQGTSLPDTGGIGTTIFYVIGGCLAAGALVLLVTKTRMRKYQG